jgi:succinate dehydrogenase assembly factor 2
LLDEPDWDIFYWSVQKREPPPRWKDSTLLKK